MTLEIAGGRLLAPFFGSDIFVWGSIIGVFMVALAVGYYVGGKAADWLPRLAALAVIEMLAGLLLLLLPALGRPLCGWASGSELGARAGPLVSAVALFTVPSVLLAMASPFAVRLAARAPEAMGGVAGGLFAISTAGSILGTFLTAFVLIPAAGTRGIILCAGAVEFVSALAVFMVAAVDKKSAGKAALPLAGAAVLLALAAYPRGPGVPLDMSWEQHRRVMLLSSDAAAAQALREFYERHGHTVKSFERVEDVVVALASEYPDLLVVDEGGMARLPAAAVYKRHEFLAAVSKVRSLPPPLLLIGEGGGPVGDYRGPVIISGTDAFSVREKASQYPKLLAASRRLLGQHTLVHFEESPYHLIIITEQNHVDLDGRTRYRRVLRFNNRIESAIHVDNLAADTGKPEKFETAVSYTPLLHLGRVFQPAASSVLFVGLGGGVGPSEFREHYGMDVEAVDIDAAVARVAKEYFFLTPGEHLRVFVADGRRFLERTGRRYDMIVLDAYSSAGHIPFQLVTREFFELVRSRLSGGGVVVSNVISAISGDRSRIFKSIYRTFYAAGFQNVYVFPRFPLAVEKEYRALYRDDYSARGYGMNVILVATTDTRRLTRAEILATARALRRAGERPVVVPYFEEYAGFLVDMKHVRREDVVANMEEGVIFSDDYAPVDTMLAGL